MTSSKPVIGKCKLCLKQKQLLESHLMPNALYAPGKMGIQYATRTQSGQNPDHMKAHLLCVECERRFNQLGESEVLRWLAPKARKQFPLHDRLRVALPCGEIPPFSVYKGADVGVDTEKFAYFTLSVAWRRSTLTLYAVQPRPTSWILCWLDGFTNVGCTAKRGHGCVLSLSQSPGGPATNDR